MSERPDPEYILTLTEKTQQYIANLEADIERLQAENKLLSEYDGLPTAGAQYVYALKTIEQLRTSLQEAQMREQDMLTSQKGE